MNSFEEADLPKQLLSQLAKIGYSKPTPIQAESMPLVLEGKDILGTAQTGTGKTGSFAIPLIAQMMRDTAINALILLPTRELAIQINKSLKDFIGKAKIPTTLLIGGESMIPQLNNLRNNPRIIIGTPGRVNDHLNRKSLKINKTNFLVLDEVDRMLDMGFGIQLETIAKFLPSRRQTLMFSATLPSNINALSDKYLSSPARITIGMQNQVADNIEERNIKIQDAAKFERLIQELNERKGSILVFVRTKFGAEKMAIKLQAEGHKADALHGNLRQNRRNKVITAFRNKKYTILVATGVASRGIDIPHIAHVINYDLPEDPEDYIHRVGRTSRNGNKGYALNFITNKDKSKWNAIQRLVDPDYKEAKQDLAEKPQRPSKKRSGRNFPKRGMRTNNRPFINKKVA
jgi:superfamily II DNA/RNA helicase